MGGGGVKQRWASLWLSLSAASQFGETTFSFIAAGERNTGNALQPCNRFGGHGQLFCHLSKHDLSLTVHLFRPRLAVLQLRYPIVPPVYERSATRPAHEMPREQTSFKRSVILSVFCAFKDSSIARATFSKGVDPETRPEFARWLPGVEQARAPERWLQV